MVRGVSGALFGSQLLFAEVPTIAATHDELLSQMRARVSDHPAGRMPRPPARKRGVHAPEARRHCLVGL
jgi:hypothetical protein